MGFRQIKGKFGSYHCSCSSGKCGSELYFITSEKPGVDAIEGGIVIPAEHLAAFCTELIHMARDLGVTGDISKGEEA